jgi:hypothetical protein
MIPGACIGQRTDAELGGSLAPESDFRTINAEYARVTSRRAVCRRDSNAGQETQFHQSPRDVLRKIDCVQERFLAFAKFDQCRGPSRGFLETELQQVPV